MHPSEAVVIVREISKDAVKLFVMPKPDAVRSILNETFWLSGLGTAPLFCRWASLVRCGCVQPIHEGLLFQGCRRAGGQAPGQSGTLERRDQFHGGGRALGHRQRYHGTAAHYAACDQVPIVGIQKPGRKPNDPPQLAGYKLATVLTVDKFLRHPDTGEIISVQFVDKDGRKITWEK